MTPEQTTLAAMKPSKGLAGVLLRAGHEVPPNALDAVRLARDVIGSTGGAGWWDSFSRTGLTSANNSTGQTS